MADPRAVFYMLDAIEHQIRNIKALLQDAVPQAPASPPSVPRGTSYLPDEVEDRMHDILEKQRLAMIQEDEAAMQAAYDHDPLAELRAQ